MTGVTFQAPDLDFTSDCIPMPQIPRVGDQIFLSDFISEEQEEEILRKNTNPDIDALFVSSVCWFRSQKQKEVFTLITLFNKK